MAILALMTGARSSMGAVAFQQDFMPPPMPVPRVPRLNGQACVVAAREGSVVAELLVGVRHLRAEAVAQTRLLLERVLAPVPLPVLVQALAQAGPLALAQVELPALALVLGQVELRALVPGEPLALAPVLEQVEPLVLVRAEPLAPGRAELRELVREAEVVRRLRLGLAAVVVPQAAVAVQQAAVAVQQVVVGARQVVAVVASTSKRSPYWESVMLFLRVNGILVCGAI